MTIKVDREPLDASFIKILDDQTMRDTLKKTPLSFVLFHADHQVNSDLAYFKYAKVAKKYKKNAEFFVVPASVGADVARSYSIPGNPCLMHFRGGTKTAIYQGRFTENGIDRFLSNYSSPQIIVTNVEENVLDELSYQAKGASIIMALFGDNSTLFGRSALGLSAELSPYFTFIQFTKQKAASEIGVRFPSLLLFRTEDSQKFVYEGEPDKDDMFIWSQRNSIPAFKKLRYDLLFSFDGIPLKNVIAFYNPSNNEETDKIFKFLGESSVKQQWIKCFYADPREYTSLVKLVGTDKGIIYASTNYTQFSYKIGSMEEFQDFYEEKMELKTVSTPPSIYNDLRPVSEFAFEKMGEEGPFFALFSSAFCVKCKPMKTAAFDAAITIRRNGGNVRWAFWDITKATPSFQQNITLGVPSVWYFPSSDPMSGDQYSGPTNFLSIIEWVHGKNTTAFDLDKIMTKETGSTYDEI